MKLSVVIPNYNGANLLKKNLPVIVESLAPLKKDEFEIIVSDDDSRDDSVSVAKEALEKLGVNYEVIEAETNRGFSSNINRGIYKAKGDLVALFNTDIAPSKDFITPVIEDFRNDANLFGVGMMDKSIENGQTILRGRGLASWQRGFLIHRRGEVDKPDTFWISGGSSVVNREKLMKLKGFDAIYDPFYWEDIDLSYRARKAGYNILFDSRSIAEHRHEEGAIKKHYQGNKIKVIAYRNQFIFVWKNITDLNLIISHILWLPYHIIRAALSMDTAFLKGFIFALALLPVIISKRLGQSKSLYRRKDKEVIGQ